MEHLYIKGLKRLENRAVMLDGPTFEQLYTYINSMTVAINTLIDKVSSLEADGSKIKSELETHSKNIQIIANALKGAYDNE